MKFNQESAPILEEIIAPSGGRPGDVVLFSSHNPANRKDGDHLSNYCCITLDKLYTLNERAYIVNDAVIESTCGSHIAYYGQYDIIVKAPTKDQEPVFMPVVLTLESKGEVALMAALLGATSEVKREAFFIDPDHTVSFCYSQMDKVAPKDGQHVEVKIYRKG